MFLIINNTNDAVNKAEEKCDLRQAEKNSNMLFVFQNNSVQ